MSLKFFWSSLAVEGGAYLDVKINCADGWVLYSNKLFLSLISYFEHLVDYNDDLINLIMSDFTFTTVTNLFNGFVFPQVLTEESEFYVYESEPGTSIAETTHIDKDGSQEVEGTNYGDNSDEREDYHYKNLEKYNEANEESIGVESYDVSVPLKEVSDKLDVSQDKSSTCMVKNRDGSQQHVCSICGKLFTSRKNYKVHEYQIHQMGLQRNFKCTYSDCHKTFAFQFLLTKHINVCHAEYVDCNLCQKTFKSQKSLKRHVKLKHSSS